MYWPTLESGRSYRLRREFEVREEKTGIPRLLFRKGDVLTIRKLDTDEDRAYIEGQTLPIPLGALRRAVEPAAPVAS